MQKINISEIEQYGKENGTETFSPKLQNILKENKDSIEKNIKTIDNIVSKYTNEKLKRNGDFLHIEKEHYPDFIKEIDDELLKNLGEGIFLIIYSDIKKSEFGIALGDIKDANLFYETKPYLREVQAYSSQFSNGYFD